VIQPTYAAAQPAADRIYRLSAAQHATTLPDQQTLAALIDAAFWTSLRREEGYIPRISLAFVAPQHARQAVTFATSFSLDPGDLTKLGPAVERTGLHLGVWPQQQELRVWGITRNLPPFSLVLEVVLPGLLVVKQSPSEESGKFINIAVLQGDEIKIIDPHAEVLRSESSILLQLAVSMRAHGRGGTLLVVPAGSPTWAESILQPITYSVVPSFPGLADLMRTQNKPTRRWEDALVRAVDGIAGLTAVDGATLITADYELLAFGAKIVRRHGRPLVAQVMITEPVVGRIPMIAEPAQLGGTRHLSAAQFVHDQPDAIALVASQDGQFTVFAWPPSDERLQAHHIDVLLL